ncbi:hypothetical protein FHX80_115452 [Streptomyces brevispora]|uniref:Uncharacterized protein n=1 Tax=Streptomyces brevispora TaxID=887462 RepID=A0A561V5Q7_9ACTN|nr:hypothetical protein [Streptomyces brevispora]TWG06952.1 hypothetical protein FHX80_115452 [Streptomyces brevispora]
MSTPNYQNPGPYQAPHPGAAVPPALPPRKPSRAKSWLTHGAAAFVALFIGVGIGASGGSGTEQGDAKASGSAKPGPTVTVTGADKARPAPTVTKTVTAKPKPPKKTQDPGPATVFDGDGEYLVGEDIQAGTYRTAGADGSFGCYWERAKNASGEFDSIIANNNLKGPGRVTLNKGEYFKTNRCQEWKRTS